MEIGANIDAKNGFGETALVSANRYRHTKIVSLLLEKGANINAKTNNGYTALHLAARGGHTEIVSLLPEKGVMTEGRNQLKMVETGKQSDWKEEQKPKDKSFPWGWPARKHKSLIEPITTVANGTGKSTSYVFTYENVKKAKSILKPNAIDEETGQVFHKQLFASFPYRPMVNSTYVKELTAKELKDMNFGLKQKGPMCFNNKDGQATYTISDHVDGKEPFGDFKDDEEKKCKNNSIHRMAVNKTAINSVSNKPKRGLGPKFFNRGANACINAIVTRYDRYGNV